jgi:hypothetical protein
MAGKLTELQVKNAKPGAAKYTMAAGHGLTLIVMPDGSKYWRLRSSLSEIKSGRIDDAVLRGAA